MYFNSQCALCFHRILLFPVWILVKALLLGDAALFNHPQASAHNIPVVRLYKHNVPVTRLYKLVKYICR